MSLISGCMNKMIAILAIWIFWNPFLSAQGDGEKIGIGEYRTLYSGILKETRRVWVHLPDSYSHTTKRYPVMVKCDALSVPLFAARIHDLSTTELASQIPEIILVSIENTDRTRDMSPVKTGDIEAGADNFIRFIGSELIPFIDRNYRTTEFRILMGESSSALLTVYAFLTRTDLFDGYIASSPELSMCPDLLEQWVRQNPMKGIQRRKSLYIVYGEKDPPRILESVPTFSRWLKELNSSCLDFSDTMIKGAGHVPADSFKLGLIHTFLGYLPPDSVIGQGTKALESYFTDFQTRIGFRIYPNPYAWYRYARMLLNEGKTEQATAVLTELLLRDPVNPSTTESVMILAGLHAGQGDIDQAVDLYRTLMTLHPEMAGFLSARINRLQSRPSAQTGHR